MMKPYSSPAALVRALALAVPLLITGCEKQQPADKPNEKPAAKAEPAAPAKPAADQSSPEATVKTLIAACAAKDKAGVAACFSKASEGEFKSIAGQSATDQEWTEFFDFFKGAAVTGAEGPKVSVKLAKRDEVITLAKEGSDWKIMGF